MNELIAPVQEPALATALYVAADLTAWETGKVAERAVGESSRGLDRVGN